jgi:hypothetical protein
MIIYPNKWLIQKMVETSGTATKERHNERGIQIATT